MSYSVPRLPEERAAGLRADGPGSRFPAGRCGRSSSARAGVCTTSTPEACTPPDAEMALQSARDVYTRRREGISLWVVPSSEITASDADDADSLFEPTGEKPYRDATFYQVPEEVKWL